MQFLAKVLEFAINNLFYYSTINASNLLFQISSNNYNIVNNVNQIHYQILI